MRSDLSLMASSGLARFITSRSLRWWARVLSAGIVEDLHRSRRP